jgi:glycosyltransferase involved in cell wall biosynthesis
MILFFGNKLSRHGNTPTFMEGIGPKFQEKYDIILTSEIKQIVPRMLEMIWVFLKYLPSSRLILIESYSKKAFWYTFILAMLSRMFGKKYIPILHGGDYKVRLDQNRKLCRMVFKNAYINVSPSLFLKKLFEERGFEVKYIPNFIEIENYPPRKQETFLPKLIWVRSFHAIYNPKMAVDVLLELSMKYKNAELCMIGPDKDGSQELTMEYARSKGVFDRMVFTGMLSKKDWIEKSKGYDIFINTTNFDNHPISVIEAMALAFPIVSTNAGGIPYLIHDGVEGLLTDKNAAREMSDKIEMLINDPELAKRISSKAREKAIMFDWNTIKPEWFRLIDPIVNPLR